MLNALRQEQIGDTVATRVANFLRTQILYTRIGYEPGERILTDDLTRSLGVSATPIKEALKQLVAEGLVVIEPRRGFFVSSMSERDLEEVLTLREGLEVWSFAQVDAKIPSSVLSAMGFAVEQATVGAQAADIEGFIRADMHFHRSIAGLAENRRLSSVYEQLLTQSHIGYLYSPRIDGPSQEAVEEHRNLVTVLSGGDLSKGIAALRTHWTNSRRRMLEGYRAYWALREDSSADAPISSYIQSGGKGRPTRNRLELDLGTRRP